MKQKIVVIIPSLIGGGAEKVMINIATHLNRELFDITLIVLNKQGVYEDILPKDIRIIDLKSERVRYSIFKMIKAINQISPNVIISTLGHLNIALLFIKLFIKNKPKFIIREANTPSKDMAHLKGIKKYLTRYLYSYMYKKSDYIIAQCKYMKEDIEKFFNIKSDKIIPIYNPLDIKVIEKLKTEFNPYDNRFINLVAVGRLSYQKGFDKLIEAFSIVKEEINNIHLTILGEGALKIELEEKAKFLDVYNHISFVDFKKNPYPYYYYADMYILSSRWEGFPNTLLEALACNVKVVATDCKSGPREILGENEYGILAKENDTENLAKCIIEYLYSKNYTSDRANYFDIDKIIKEYENILIKN